MRVVIPSEAYPPRAGGAGWSTRALALALREAGHQVSVITTSPGPEDLDGLSVRRLESSGPKRFVIPRAFAAELRHFPDAVVHAQHLLSALGALAGGRGARVAVTVRDHWPMCFWSTRISRGALCPRCGILPMTRCIQGRVAAPAPLAWGAIPYMWADLTARRSALGRAGATLAVSEALGAELRAAGIQRVEVLPNMIDAEETRALAEAEPSFALPRGFLLFVGKLELNKGAQHLVPAVAEAKTGLPLVVLGEGTLADDLKVAAASHDVALSLHGWVSREDVLSTMARATALVFPSFGQESLSRVLLEGLALGTPMAAMDTGGTREILVDGESGILARDAEELSDAVARLASDSALRQRLSEGARARAEAFSPAALLPGYEAVYRRLRSS